jgi:hypothetical protein
MCNINFFHCMGVVEQIVCTWDFGLCLMGLLWYDVFWVTKDFGLVGKF